MGLTTDSMGKDAEKAENAMLAFFAKHLGGKALD
jgi:hypothetical protein